MSASDYHGNNYDLVALVAALFGGILLLFCASSITAFLCPPIPLVIFGLIALVPLIFGAISLVNAPQSLDPARTRLLGWFGIGGACLVVLAILVLVVGIILFFGFAVFSTPIPSGPRL